MKAYVFDGTPDEVIQAVAAMQGASPIAAIVPPPPVAPTENLEEDDKLFVTTEIARRVFNRRPLSDEQKKVIKLLAKNSPDWTHITALHAEVDYTPAQFAGLLGAFGRRLSHTDGYVSGSWLFDAMWDGEEGCWSYKLPKSVLEAVKLEKLD